MSCRVRPSTNRNDVKIAKDQSGESETDDRIERLETTRHTSAESDMI